jgi:hypothetical protein
MPDAATTKAHDADTDDSDTGRRAELVRDAEVEGTARIKDAAVGTTATVRGLLDRGQDDRGDDRAPRWQARRRCVRVL